MPASSADRPGLARRLRLLLADVLELADVRLQLLALEAGEAGTRLLAVLLSALLAVAFLCFGLLFLAAFLTVLLWDTHRLLALGIFTTLFLGGGAGLAWLAVARARAIGPLLAATRHELARDCERLRS